MISGKASEGELPCLHRTRFQVAWPQALPFQLFYRVP